MSRVRLSIALFLLLPVVLLGWLTFTQPGLQWLYRQVEFYLPPEISLNRLEGALIGPISVDGFTYRQAGTQITAERIIFDWSPTALLTANIDINQLHIQTLNIVLTETEKTQSAADPSALITLPEINLPWRLSLKDAQVNGLRLTQQEQNFVVNRITLNASSLFDQVTIKQLSASADSYQFDIKGGLRPGGNYRHKLDVRWQVRLPSSALIQGKGQLKGDMKSTVLKQTLSGPLQLTLDGQVKNILEQLNWQLSVDASQFDVSLLETSWPALTGALKLDAKGDLYSATLSGKLKGNTPETGALDANFDIERLSDNTIQIKQLKIHTPGTDTHIETHGEWKPADDGGEVKLVLNWQNLRWPMHEPAWFNSTVGNGTIAGNIDHYAITMSSDSPWPDILASSWQADATGDLSGLNIKSLRITALDGETIASGRLDWSPELHWKADISASDIDPASLFPQWPGQLKASLSSSGRLKNGQLQIEVDIKQITGSLRNYPVSLHSQLQWREDHLQITQLNYQSGKSHLKLQGQLGETLKLNWNLNSSDLAELYPQARGELQAQGKLNGPQKKPLIETSAKGSKLSYSNFEIGAIETAFAVDLQHWKKVDIKLAAQALKLNDYQLKSLAIDTDDQQLQAQVVSKHVSAMLKLAGQPSKDGWSGQVEQVEIKSELYDNWQLQSPTKISFSATALQLDTLCMQNEKQASLCADIKTKDSAWYSRLQIDHFPLQLFSTWLPPELKLESLADGMADVSYQADKQLLAKVDIKLPAGAINYPRLDGENDRREYRSGELQLSLDSQGLKAATALSMNNEDKLQARLELPGFSPLALRTDQPLKASTLIHARDLRLLESFIPEISELQGELNLKLDASGTLEQPIFIGQANIVNAALQIPRLGLNIKELSLYSQSENNEKFNFRLDARSGDGTLRISGHTLLDQKAGWPTEINIEGEDFEVASIPEARLQASPDLQIKLKNRHIDIKGKVHIPYAKLQPKDITQAATVSSDAVIIGGEQTVAEKWLITTSVRLTLGERVHFYGFGFEGRLGGNLLLEDEPGQLTRATGEITIPEGNYRAYGQRLEVVHGRAIYTGSPLTNPGLDLRAVRKVNDITAGLNVSGSLNQPKLDIFSTPAMGQTDALAYLILGHPLESADNEDGNMMAKAALALGLSGGDVIARSLGDRFGLDDMRVESSDQGDQAALVVGRYLSPRLYASYGVGLIESINTLTLRYHVSKRWLIKVESGGYQGADILYTIER